MTKVATNNIFTTETAFFTSAVASMSCNTIMTSRLDRLFILLETGANAATKRAAAQQLGEVQSLHPHELHHLLARVSILLKSPQWDTRIAAAHAIQAIVSKVPIWNPEPVDKMLTQDIDGQLKVTENDVSVNKAENELIEESKVEGRYLYPNKILTTKLNFLNFDVSQVLLCSSYLTASEGNEYDLSTENENISTDSKIFSVYSLSHPYTLKVNSNSLNFLDNTDVVMSSSNLLQVNSDNLLVEEVMKQSSRLSRREMNRARRKARSKQQCPREPDYDIDKEIFNQGVDMSKTFIKKIRLDNHNTKQSWYDFTSDMVTDPRCAVPDATGCWPDSAVHWPLEAFAENLLYDIFSFKWEVRHGAATAFRELIKLHGQGAGKSKKQTRDEMNQAHEGWLIDSALRLVCVLAIDRFSDFISDQVVAPVRETCAQAFGSLIKLISNNNITDLVDNQISDNTKTGTIKGSDNTIITGFLSVLLKLLEHDEWEARHGALLALKYLFIVRRDLLKNTLPVAFPLILQCLSDSVEDVGATAASALSPVAQDLPWLLSSAQLQSINCILWELLEQQDDLTAACNSFMGLLAAILSLPTAREFLAPQPLSLILPRLWPFFNHPSSSVRKATLQTLETLVAQDKDISIDSKKLWGEDGVVRLREALQNVLQRILIDHVPVIQDIAERVWEKLIVQSDLELLLHAVCPVIGTWLCLAMQSELIPYNTNLLINITTRRTNNVSTKISLPSELKIYLGGTETVPQITRHLNVARARCMASRMLGLLSKYIVKPAPGINYSTAAPSPTLCYAKVLLVHLNSKSALQRTVAALIMAHWATFNEADSLVIPEILKEQLFICLNEYIYYDEIASCLNRLLHECHDYIAILKQQKILFHSEINTDTVMNLDQIVQLASTPVSSLQTVDFDGSGNASTNTTAVESKLLENLEERRHSLEVEALNKASQQQTLHITVTAALAGAATMLHCLPKPPQTLNPLIKPLMESIKREKDGELQKLSAKHLAHLVYLCVTRNPCPNSKIISNLCMFLCSDSELSPRIIVSNGESDVFNGIITLSHRQKEAESLASLRSNSSGILNSSGLGRPLVMDISLEQTQFFDEPETNAAARRTQGAKFALTEIASLFGTQLPSKLPHLWVFMLPDSLRNYSINSSKIMSLEETNKLVLSLQVLEVVVPSLDDALIPCVMKCLENICFLLTNPYKILRHMGSRCIAVLASLRTKETMDFVVPKIISFLELNALGDEAKKLSISPSEVNTYRQGASEALACLTDILGLSIVPYAVIFMVPLLGRMSDKNEAVRLTSSATFATLIQLLPLDSRKIKEDNLTKERIQKHDFLEQLLNPSAIPDTKLPFPIFVQLRSYQQQGLNWLNFLNRYQLHGILCDDMGLGKTLQTLSILALDHHWHNQAPTSLVVCPPTLTGHWIFEAKKFFKTENLSVVHYSGIPLEREKMRLRIESYKLVVASYDIVRRDIDFFQAIQWNYCVLDEGHIIKNGKTKNAKAIKKLHAHHRLILSGTPIQNNVLELWSLFDFLMPGFLGSEKQFSLKYSKPILASREPKASAKEQEAGALAMEALHRQILPFLLRRIKEDVLQDLPPKITQDYYCDLSDLQKSLYEDFKTNHSATVVRDFNTLDHVKRRHVFEALRYLRNVCNHPKLVLHPSHSQYQTVIKTLACQNNTLSDIEHGGKLPALKQLLLDCGIGQFQNQHSQPGALENQSQMQLVSQHRALIFCQLKAMLDIVENDLLKTHLPSITYLRLDGSVPSSQRHSLITRFNNDPTIDVLMLTTQVGGLGLNLTGADTVIFVEHDWNPMKDLQAMDRAHRMGQKKVVNVYRLITKNTLEEKIMSLQKFKLLTANTIVSTDNTLLQSMRTEQLLDLFTLSQEKELSTNHTGEDEYKTKVSGSSSIKRSLLESLPELWEPNQYDDEYDLDVFLSTFKDTC